MDIYNSFSLKYGLLCGGEDIDTLEGDLILTQATGNEEFISFDSIAPEFSLEKEIVYKDNLGIVCRSLNWRESKRNVLSSSTKNAILCVEFIQENGEDNFLQGIEYLKKEIIKNLGGTNEVFFLDSENSVIFI